jgi:predicted GH43/DUF377 family glycosyl hydrolase
MAHLRILFFALLSLVLSSAFGQISWQRYEGNPVLTIGPSNPDDPKQLKLAYTPRVLCCIASAQHFDATGLYRMWFSSTTPNANTMNISHALSLNGIDWFLYSNNPVMKVGSPGTFDSRWVVNMDVMFVKGQYLMYYQGFDGVFWQIGLATSENGVKWKKYEGNPIVRNEPGTWESTTCGAPEVAYNGYSYSMIYTGYNGTTYAIGLATSPNGVDWTKHPSNPVLTKGSPGSWDQNSVTSIAMFTAGGKYYLLYGGGPFTGIGLATSLDLINWTKYEGNPVLQPRLGTWEGRIEYGSVVLKENTVHFWYSGNGPGDVWQIGYATSPFTPQTFEGLSDTRTPDVPQAFQLKQAFPNPFNPETRIEYNLPTSEYVTLRVFDELGRELETIVNEVKPAGYHVANWNAVNYASGVYIYRISAGNFTDTKKMVLTK